MKTRIRRIWLSVSLAVGSLATPAVGFVKAHDLPTRWSSGSNSTSSWNYLLDDCLDTPVWHDSQRNLLVPDCLLNSPLAPLQSVPAIHQAPLGSIASDNLVTDSLPRAIGSHGCVEDFDALLSRSSLARYSSEMSCWVSNWEKLQQQAGNSVRSDLLKYRSNASVQSSMLAAYPDEQSPPSPAANELRQAMLAFAGVQSEAIEDTCTFEREYQALASLEADCLGLSDRDVEVSDAAIADQVTDPSSVQDDVDYEALVFAMAQAVDRERAALREIIAGDDAMSSSWQCGGHALESIVESHPANAAFAPSRFAPGIVDDFMQDDLSQTDMHWLGGLGKAWRLQASIRGSSTPIEAVASPARMAEEMEGAIAAAMIAPEDWRPPAPASSQDEEFAGNDSSIDPSLSLIVNDATQQLSDWAERAAESIDGWQRSAAFTLQAMRYFAAPMAYKATDAMPDITSSLALGMAWVEEIECVMTAELCGWDSAYTLGQQFSELASVSARESSKLSMAMVTSLDAAPSVTNPEMFVIYTDSNGVDTAVPASLARAWNRPDFDEGIVSDSGDGEYVVSNSSYNDEPGYEAGTSVELDIVGLQSELLIMLARHLDAIGIACLQTADEIHNWADHQIASRNDTSNR